MVSSNRSVVLLYGGFDNESVVSYSAHASVHEAIKQAGYNVINKECKPDNIQDIMMYLINNKDNIIVFMLIHGKYGEDGRLVGFLDILNIPHTTSNFQSLVLCMHKAATKSYLDYYAPNILLPKGDIVNHQDLNDYAFTYPCIIKPCSSGSSILTYLLKSSEDLNKVKSSLIDSKLDFIVEEYIQGTEVTLSIINDKVLCSSSLDIKGTIFDFDTKVSKEPHIVTPAAISTQLEVKVKDLAYQIYRLLQCRGIARVDFIITQDEQVYFLEVNTIPGMSPASFIPSHAEYAGLTLKDICQQLIRNAKT